MKKYKNVMNCCILLVGIIISIMGCKNSNTGNDTEMPIVFSEQNNAEIDVYMSDTYYDYSGVSLKHYAAKFSRNTYRQVREREYSR